MLRPLCIINNVQQEISVRAVRSKNDSLVATLQTIIPARIHEKRYY